MDPATLITTIGAIYGALQGLAQVLMAVFPKKTIAWKVCKFIVSGPVRPEPGVGGNG